MLYREVVSFRFEMLGVQYAKAELGSQKELLAECGGGRRGVIA